jgi:hypothetical protein
MFVDRKQWPQHLPKQVPFSGHILYSAPELSPDRPREDQAAFLQHGADLVLQIAPDPHQARPGDQKRSGLLAVLALNRDLTILPNPDQFGETALVVLVALVHPYRQRGMGVARVDADHR